MIFSDILNTYFGWCPRLQMKSERIVTNPLTYLSTIGQVAVIALLSAWGLYNAGSYQSIIAYLSYGDLILIPQYSALLLSNLVRLVSGIILLVLITDFIVSRKVLRRHRLELSSFFVSQAFFWFVAPFFEVIMYLQGGGGQLAERLPFVLVWNMIESVFFGYLAYRIINNKSLLGKSAFILMSFLFASIFAITINPAYIRWPQELLGWSVIGLRELVYAVAAAFCISIYLKLRRSSGYELALPPIIRAMIFIYGFLSTGLFTFLITRNTDYLFMTGSLVSSLDFIFYLGLMGVAFLPLRFRIGENSGLDSGSTL